MTTHIKKTATETENGISEMLHDASERIVDFKDESLATLGKRIDAVGKLIKKHPFGAVGIGIGTGFLLSRIIRWF